MAKRVQDQKRPAPARRRRVDDNVREQKKRHAAIQKEMNEGLAAQRAVWYREFRTSSRPRAFNHKRRPAPGYQGDGAEEAEPA